MNFKIYVIGEKIPKNYLEGIKEYEKRLGRYCKIKLQQFKSEELLLKHISNKSLKIYISVQGEMLTSEELAEKINQLGISGMSDVSIIIGAENINQNETLAISPMEMDLGIQTIVLFEQIYRSYRILNNEPYHK